jgi:hypothetical protein
MNGGPDLRNGSIGVEDVINSKLTKFRDFADET